MSLRWCIDVVFLVDAESKTNEIDIMLDSISSPSAICSPAPYMKSIGPKSTVCSPQSESVRSRSPSCMYTGAVTSHTVQIKGKYESYWYVYPYLQSRLKYD